MAKIGIIPMAAKPYHAGHDGLVRLAAKENDQVLLFVSTGDRDDVSGEAMLKIWQEQIEPSLPGNVKITYGGSPVGNAFVALGKANEAGSTDEYVIYSDPDDAGRFDDKSLQKYAANIKVTRRPIERTSTVNISGTKMREFLKTGDKKSFMKYLPKGIDGNFVWTTLTTMKPQPKVPAVKKTAKKPTKVETLLRGYVRGVLRN